MYITAASIEQFEVCDLKLFKEGSIRMALDPPAVTALMTRETITG
jgi:hypothetical protein